MTSPRAPLIGLPTLRLSSWASSSLLRLIRSASLASDRPRLPAAQFAQPLRSSKAAVRRRDRALDVLAAALRGRGMTRPLAGLTTSKVWPSAASTVSPPMTMRAVVGGERSSVVMA